MAKHTFKSTVAALMLLAPAAATFVAQPVHAQARTATAPRITNMALNSDSGLSPGATLRVQVYATPKAKRASLTLGDSGITVPLREATRGNYTGTYVVRRSDRIDPTQLMTARVTFGERSYSRQFNFPPGFQALAMGNAPQQAQIERFVMRPIPRLEPGRELHFRLNGVPGGDAWLDIPGVINGVDLAESRPGVYEGSYTIRRRDDPDAFRSAVATLRKGQQRDTARLDLNVRDDDFRDRDRDRADRDRDQRDARRDGDGRFPLSITSHQNNAVVDANGNLAIQGRTAPHANVRVQVDSVASVGGLLGVTQPVADQTVQADRNGNFNVLVTPRGLPIPGTRYDVRLTATNGNQTAEERITLIQRQG
ncbi:hypothetical protein H8N03_02685 [Ramlibacter sp. USB13]|uniref:Uncharacterized protein n=1 Tax=Ramlibacter cellulosilyticus TaxID=2764187 RepID=A0A923MLH4_9BURK|nr:hypothetical protein [Ramlibacter cellulosilyticus]MBC5781832.1 hypothetical protein [Ramlibacter cellulosilyticus]